MNEQDFHSEFINFTKELTSFLYRLMANKQDAEDLVQDTYLKAAAKLHLYQSEKSSIKTWVFTIALNTAKNQLSRMKRWGENDLTVCEEYHTAKPGRFEKATKTFYDTPDAKFEMKEHLDYCFTCTTKTLDLTQQICLLLKEVYGFKQDEIIQITDLSEGKVKHGITDARKNMKRIFHNRCALINKDGVCHQCTELNGIFNPEQDAHIKVRELKFSKSSGDSDQDKLFDIRLRLVGNTDPLNSSSPLHNHFLEHLPLWVDVAQSEK